MLKKDRKRIVVKENMKIRDLYRSREKCENEIKKNCEMKNEKKI